MALPENFTIKQAVQAIGPHLMLGGAEGVTGGETPERKPPYADKPHPVVNYSTASKIKPLMINDAYGTENDPVSKYVKGTPVAFQPNSLVGAGPDEQIALYKVEDMI